MYGFISKEYGVAAIKLLCRPLELFLGDETIGRILQGLHVLGYFICIGLAYYFPAMRPYVLAVLLGVMTLFWIFGGCILTKAEIHYLKRYETVPGLFLKLIGINIEDRKTSCLVQSALSLIVLAVPIIVIGKNMWGNNKIDSDGVRERISIGGGSVQ
jgi:prepilin signal peptidase PulO-like enzyme (type II secretory pathway)